MLLVLPAKITKMPGAHNNQKLLGSVGTLGHSRVQTDLSCQTSDYSKDLHDYIDTLFISMHDSLVHILCLHFRNMSGDKKVSRHVAYEQVKSMIDFMGQNIEFAAGGLRTLEARHTSKRLWAELTKILNDCKGTKKSADGWSKYWSDFKNKLKNKAKSVKRQTRGSAMKKSIYPLTKLEKRALVILGPHFDRKLSRDDSLPNNKLPEVKLEAYQEKNDFYECEGDHERLSGSDNESEGSSMQECQDNNGDVNVTDSMIHNLYPKWLVEVEKKRADAELLRAKAEVKRASAAAKSADAALIQAEAMRKLAEAAATQAAAITRIAVAIENHSHVEDVTSVSSTVSMPGLTVVV